MGVALGGGAVWCFKPTKVEQVAPPDTRTEEQKIGDMAYLGEYHFRLKLIEEGKAANPEIRDVGKYIDLSPKGNVKAAQEAKQQALAYYREANGKR
jgi:hypothetical protein